MVVQRFLLCVSLIIPLISGMTMALANTSVIEEARELYGQGELQTAYDRIYQIPLGDLDPKRMALIQLFRGVLSYEMKRYPKALTELDRSIKLGTRLRDVSHYYKGLALMATENYAAASVEFNSVEDWDASDFLKWQTQYQLGQIAMKNKNYPEAKKIFKVLERKMRSEEVYPNIVYSLLEIAVKDKNNRRACHWGQKLYKNYPTFEKVKHWDLLWSNNKVGQYRMNCSDTLAGRKSRLRRLQWQGASEKALVELQTLQKTKEKPFDKDVMMANYLVNEGHVNEALSKLLPHFNGKTKDFKYVMLLAKAAARAGEFQTAIGVYTKAAKMFKGSKSRTALFSLRFFKLPTPRL